MWSSRSAKGGGRQLFGRCVNLYIQLIRCRSVLIYKNRCFEVTACSWKSSFVERTFAGSFTIYYKLILRGFVIIFFSILSLAFPLLFLSPETINCSSYYTMVDERSSLTKVVGKTKEVFRSPKYGSTNDQKLVVAVNTFETKQKYRKLK